MLARKPSADEAMHGRGDEFEPQEGQGLGNKTKKGTWLSQSVDSSNMSRYRVCILRDACVYCRMTLGSISILERLERVEQHQLRLSQDGTPQQVRAMRVQCAAVVISRGDAGAGSTCQVQGSGEGSCSMSMVTHHMPHVSARSACGGESLRRSLGRLKARLSLFSQDCEEWRETGGLVRMCANVGNFNVLGLSSE